MRSISLRFIGLLMILTVGWGLAIGKDLGWDLMNHHFYLPYAWASGHLSQDLFAAGPQSYQNPLGYFPFYFMVIAGWPSWLVGTTLGALHALNIVVIYLISRLLWPNSYGWSIVATTMAWLAPIFLVLVASTSVDVLSSVLVLSCLLGLLWRTEHAASRSSLIGLCAVLVALAFSIKLSNFIFVISCSIVLLVQSWRKSGWGYDWLAWCLGGAFGAVLGMGWYSWEMYQQFGNPVFPLANGIFHSPFAPDQTISAGRFTVSFSDVFSLPLRLMEMRRFVYYEGFAPDLRFAALALVLVVTLGLVLFRPARSAFVSRLTRFDISLLAFTVVSYVIWAAVSGNGRYVVPLFLVAGLLFVRGIYLVAPGKVGRFFVVTLLLLQGFYGFTATDFRFSAEPWDDEPFFKVQVALQLREEPVLHLLLGVQTNASLLAAAGLKGNMANPLGQMSIPMSGAAGDRLIALLATYQGRVRAVFPDFRSPSPESMQRSKQRIDQVLYRFGLTVDVQDCLPIQVSVADKEGHPIFAWVQRQNMFIGKDGGSRFVSCRLEERQGHDLAFEGERTTADKVFAVLEQKCPNLYGPRGLPTEWSGTAWQRFYPNSDSTVLVSREEGVTGRILRAPLDRRFGSFDEVLHGHGNFDCTAPNMRTPD